MLLNELSEFVLLRTVQTNVARVDCSLSYVETIVQIHDHSLASLDSLVPNVEYFVKVLILALVSIDLQYVLYSIQEVIESRLVLQDQQI